MGNTLTEYTRTLTRASSLQTAAARLPHMQPGAMGDWSIAVRDAQEWQALATPQFPHGCVTVASDGWLQLDLDDLQGWNPFIAIAGEDAGRRFQVNTRYRWDGTNVEDSADAVFDATFGRYVRLGTASDGSLAANGKRARMLVAALDRQPWRLADTWVGWIQAA